MQSSSQSVTTAFRTKRLLGRQTPLLTSRGSKKQIASSMSLRRSRTGVFVLVVSLNPEHRVWCGRIPLVAPIRGSVEDGVVAHQELNPSTCGGVGVVDGSVIEHERCGRG